ncbi:MAG: phytoene/squalene synthase family protein [Alphaproteobacteria bacterium]|nr:phytoene/squalene synthase family protein [Alphaproteobacteria bacterium]
MPARLPHPERASPADLAACRAMIRTGSKSFYLASLLLPDRVRTGAYALYAFCRLSDDSVDEARGGARAVDALSARLDRVFADARLDGAVDRALADAVEDYAIPRVFFDALLEGLAWDAAGRRYETIEEVFDYAARVAGAVGAMMVALMGARAPHLVARACDLGVAMQLTNIARDVGEDARAGRVYLPLSWLDASGVDVEAWLARPAFNAAIESVVRRLLAEADALYVRADAGIAALPSAFRPAIGAARLLYAEIGAEALRMGANTVDRRAVVALSRKTALVGRALATRDRPGQETLFAPPLRATAYLVDAMQSAAQPALAACDGWPWALSLFAALEDRPRYVV